MSISRPLSPFEWFFVNGTHCIQMAVVLESKDACQFLLEKLKKNVLGLHVRTDFRSLIAVKNREIKVQRLPEHIPSLEHACIWTWKYTTPDITQSMGSLAANDNTVILNLNHTCGDGGYLRMIVERVFNGLPDVETSLPAAGETLFAEQIAKAKSGHQFVLEDSHVTHVFPNRTMEHPPHTGAQYITFKSNAKELSCYDPKTGKLRGLTETLWSSEILAACAFNGKIGPLGTSTCVDLRPLMPHKPTWANCNTFSNITVNAPPMRMDQTLGEMALALRQDFIEKQKAGVPFDYLRGIPEYQQERMGKAIPPPGIGIEVTNVGPLRYKMPIVDLWVQQAGEESGTRQMVSVQSSSKVTETANEVIQRFRYAPSDINEKEAIVLCRMMKYAMDNFSFRTSIGDAFKELMKYKETID